MAIGALAALYQPLALFVLLLSPGAAGMRLGPAFWIGLAVQGLVGMVMLGLALGVRARPKAPARSPVS